MKVQQRGLMKVIVICALLYTVAICSGITISQGNDRLAVAQSSTEAVLDQNGGLSDVQGYTLLFDTIANGLTGLSIFLMKIFLCYFPMTLATTLLFFAVIAFILQRSSHQTIWYRILMSIDYVLILLTAIFLFAFALALFMSTLPFMRVFFFAVLFLWVGITGLYELKSAQKAEADPIA